MFDSRLKERVMRLEYDAEQQAKKITDLQNEIDQYQKIFGDAILQMAQRFGIETPEIADIKKQSLAEKVIDNFLAQYDEEKEREKVPYIPPLDLSDDSCKHENKTLTTFSERFKYALNLLHLSVSFVRRMLGVSETKMLKYLNGDFKPGKKNWNKLQESLT